jgi:hypothetical protein
MKTNRIGNFSESTRIVRALHIPELPALDLGCGEAKHTLPLGNVRFIDALKMEGAPDSVEIGDIRKIAELVPRYSFGTCYLLDVPEHLTKPEGVALLDELQTICKRTVFFTPLGELWVTGEDHPYSHKCGWTPDEAEALGYQTWTWPKYHRFAEGQTHGAFWAWKTHDGFEISPEEVAKKAGVLP